MSEQPPVEIRRYPNRRLYDRRRRQYVTLQDIEEMVLSGTDVEVRDSRTGEDLTRQVLTQIMMERHPQKMELFPVAMLHNMLRANDLAVEMWRGYLRQSLAAVDAWQKTVPVPGPLGWMSALFPGLAPGPAGPIPASPVPPAPTSPPREPDDERLQRLARRVARLEGRDEGMPPPEGETPTSDDDMPPPEAGPPIDELEERVAAIERRRPREPKTRTRRGA